MQVGGNGMQGVFGGSQPEEILDLLRGLNVNNPFDNEDEGPDRAGSQLMQNLLRRMDQRQ